MFLGKTHVKVLQIKKSLLENECSEAVASDPPLAPRLISWAKSNNVTRGQFECDVIWFCFCFDFVRSRARCRCCSIVCLCFQGVQIKQVDCKMITKNVNDYK